MRLLFFLFLAFNAFAQSDQWKDVYKESAWEERDAWQKPKELIRLLNIRKGNTVADIGCHQGYMTVKLSVEVGHEGKVLAVDVEQYKINALNALLEKRKITNVEAIKGDYDDPHLNTTALDAALILDTYHEMDDHNKILQHIKAALKTGGRLLICEPIAESRRKESRAIQEGKHELGMNFALDDLQKAGFRIISKQDPFVDREKVKGDKMWAIVAEKI